MKSVLLAGASAAALCILAGPGAALTAEEAWQSWQTAASEAGIALSAGAEAQSGGVLTVTALALAADLDEGGTVTARLDEVVFTEGGDGSVTVTFPPAMPMRFSGQNEDGEPVEVQMSVTQTDMRYTMAGEGEAIDATYEAPALALQIEEMIEDGTPLDFTGTFAFDGLAGGFSRTTGDLPEVASRFVADALALQFGGTDPESGGTFSLAMTMADLLSETTGTGSTLFAATEDLGTLIDQGFTTDGVGSAGAITFDIEAAGMPETFRSSGSMSGGEGRLKIDAETLEYDVAYSGLDFTASGSEIPFPQVTGGLGRLGVLFQIPTQTEATGPMALRLALEDLVVGEEIWALFDGGQALPRTPATLILDLSGRLKMLEDIFAGDPDEEEIPAEVEALDVGELRLSVAGADLTGDGAFTFDNSVEGPFGPGTPAPDGTLNLQLEGGQALLDILVQIGVVPQEQAMMVRMMTGMLAVPGEGPDQLVSEITVRPDGTILANGAPLPF